MPCYSAIVPKSLTVSPDDSVEAVLKVIRKGKMSGAAVVDQDGKLLGIFSMKILLKNLIPVSVALSGGVQIDVKVTAAPGVSKRLKNVMPLSIVEVMDRKPHTISPDAALWEAVGLLTKNGNLLCVVDDYDKFHGFITYDSLVSTLENIKTSDG